MAASAADQGSAQRNVFFDVVSDDLKMLSVLHDREPDAALIRVLRDERFPDGLGLRLDSETGRQAIGMLAGVVAEFPEIPDRRQLDELAADYAAIYLTHRIQASPQESVWLDDEHLICQDSMFQVRDWYARYGMAVPNWRIRPDDHLACQLDFLGLLFSGAPDDMRLREAARFMDEHLLRWLMPFARRVAARSGTAYFAAVAMVTGCYCEELRDLIADLLDQPRPDAEEIARRMQPESAVEPVPVAFVPGIGPVL